MAASSLHILAPDLVGQLLRAWPERDSSTLDLARVLARADQVPADGRDRERAILRLFGYDLGADEALPLAGLMAALDFDLREPPADYVSADPVHLRADPNRLILFDAATVGIDAQEADALLAALNAAFDAATVRFERGAAPSRWYARLPRVPLLAVPSPRRLNGCAIEHALGGLKRAGNLNRLLTEAQMVLHGDPCNAAREAAGRAPLNSLWFSGVGALPAPLRPAPRLALGEDDLVAACARATGTAHQRLLDALPAALAGGPGGVVVLAAAMDAQPAAFLARILLPALAALTDGRLADIVIEAGQAGFRLTSGMRWRWWRRPDACVRHLSRLLEAAPGA